MYSVCVYFENDDAVVIDYVACEFVLSDRLL